MSSSVFSVPKAGRLDDDERWQRYAIKIKGATTDPIPPSNVADANFQAWWRRSGKYSIQIAFWYREGTLTDGDSGSGSYSFQLPHGFTLDAFATVAAQTSSGTVIILGSAQYGSNLGVVGPSDFDSNGITIMAASSAVTSSSSGTPINSGANTSYSFFATVPVKEYGNF